MSDERVQYKFLIPIDIKERLEGFAEKNRRSLSAEIIHRLKESLPSKADEIAILKQEAKLSAEELKTRITELQYGLRRAEMRIEELEELEAKIAADNLGIFG